MIILDYFYPIAFLFSMISHLTPWIRVSPTDLIIITREERMLGKGGGLNSWLRVSINFLTKSDVIDRIIGLVNFHFGTPDRS